MELNTIPKPDESTDTLLAPATRASQRRTTPHSWLKTVQSHVLLFGWWWETGAILVSIVCMSLISAVLFGMDGKPTRTWPLPIQPNSLVAVFSTIAKSALLVPVAESLGQLKWEFFRRPRRIEHIQAFDEATRGPWGALLFLWKTRGASLLAASGAIITVLLLAFEPFTQQVIEVYAQRAVLANGTGFVSVTSAFTMVSVEHELTGWLPRDLYLAMTTGLLDAISRQSASLPNNTHCPSLECGVEDFTSLAICAFCESEEVNFGKDSDQCLYDIQEGYSFDRIKDGAYGSPEFLTNQSIRGPMTSYSDFKKAVSEEDESSVLLRSCAISLGSDAQVNLTFQVAPRHWDPKGSSVVYLGMHSNNTEELLSLPLLREMTLSWGSSPENRTIGAEELRWVTGTNRAPLFSMGDSQYLTSGTLSACVMDEEPPTGDPEDTGLVGFHPMNIARSTCFASSSNITAMEQLDHFGEIAGTITRCRPTFCARRYQNVTVSPTGMKAGNTTDFPFTRHAIDSSSLAVKAEDEFNNTFYFDPGSSPLKDLFRRTLGSDIFTYILRTHLPQSNREWSGLFERVSDVLTQGMQSPYNPNATLLYGPAYGSEIFVRVRWVWFIVPLMLFTAATVFLIAAISRSRNSEVLYKNSIMAVLFHGLPSEDTQKVVLIDSTGKRRDGDVREDSGPMRVSFGRDDDGFLRLIKE